MEAPPGWSQPHDWPVAALLLPPRGRYFALRSGKRVGATARHHDLSLEVGGVCREARQQLSPPLARFPRPLFGNTGERLVWGGGPGLSKGEGQGGRAVGLPWPVDLLNALPPLTGF